jgi:hypothetical protein
MLGGRHWDENANGAPIIIARNGGRKWSATDLNRSYLSSSAWPRKPNGFGNKPEYSARNCGEHGRSKPAPV